MKTTEELVKDTGFDSFFVRRCLINMKEVFKPHLTYDNKDHHIVCDDEADEIFIEIKDLTSRGYELSSVKREIMRHFLITAKGTLH